MALFISKSEAAEFIRKGWETDDRFTKNNTFVGYHVYPRAAYLMTVSKRGETPDEVEIKAHDVYALMLLDPKAWPSYLLPLRKDQNK